MSNITDEEKKQLCAFWSKAIAKFCPHPLMQSEIDKGVLSELALRVLTLEAEHAALNERHQALCKSDLADAWDAGAELARHYAPWDSTYAKNPYRKPVTP